MKRTIQRFVPSNGQGVGTVMVLRDEVKEKVSDGGIVFAERAIELANQGEVRAAYEGCQYTSGDRVVFTKYSGSEFLLNGVDYLLLKEKEIQGKVIDVEIDVPDDLLPTPQTAEDVNAAAAAALALLGKSVNG